MRVRISTLIKKAMALNADPEKRDSEEAKALKQFLNKGKYIELSLKKTKLEDKVMELHAELKKIDKELDAVVDYKPVKAAAAPKKKKST
jgi:hypothetical protein